MMSDEAENWDSAQPADLKRGGRKGNGISATPVDRLPPHSIECETAALGCILLSPKECMAESIEALRDNGQEFYDLRHLTIWDALVEMYDRGITIDVISLQQQLKDKDMLEQVGGIAYLSALPDSTPSASNLNYYLGVIVEKFILRKALRVSVEVGERVYTYQGEVDQLMDTIEADMLSIRGRRQENEVKTIKTLIRENISTIEDYVQRQGVVTGIPTGFTDLDKMTSGLQASEMIVIAGRPSMGKTSLAMNIAEFVSLEAKLPVGVFSLEMSAPSLTLRMLCSRARVNLRSIREGFLAERDVPRLRTAADRLMNAPIYLDDSGALTIMQLRAKARRMAMQYDIKLAVIDYLQLLKSTNRKVKSRQEEISDISSGIKALAKELGIPIIVMSQLNREMEREKNRKPRLADLRESGAIEQDADFVGMLYRPKSDDEDSEDDYNDAVAMNLLIAKQRNGPTGDVNLTFLKSFTRFESAARVSDEDVPQQTQFPT
jgi:replicative DNA helicase